MGAKMKVGSCGLTEILRVGYRVKILQWERDFLILIREMHLQDDNRKLHVSWRTATSTRPD